MSSVLVYKSILLVPLIYILIIVIIVKDDDIKDNTNKVKDHVIKNEQGEEIFETGDRFIHDPETEVVFVRSRSKLNERLRINYDY